jgi:hypothetical protein
LGEHARFCLWPRKKKNRRPEGNEKDGGAAAVAKPARKRSPKRKPPQPLPPWKVLLHNDDKNDILFVVKTIMELTRSKSRMPSCERWRPTTPEWRCC